MAEVRDHQKAIKKAIEEAIKAIDRDHQLSKGMVIACVLLAPRVVRKALHDERRRSKGASLASARNVTNA